MNKMDKSAMDQMSALLGVTEQVLPGSTSTTLGFGNTLQDFSTNSAGGQASNSASQGPDTSALGGFAGLAMDNAAPPGTPAAEFRANIQLALNQHLPQIATLARSVLHDFENACNSDVNPNKTCNDYMTLINMMNQFYEFLRETGVGALPLLEAPAGQNTDLDAMALDIMPSPTKDPNANMSEEELRVSLNSIVNAQYSREHRVQNNAGVVFNRLISKIPPGGL